MAPRPSRGCDECRRKKKGCLHIRPTNFPPLPPDASDPSSPPPASPSATLIASQIAAAKAAVSSPRPNAPTNAPGSLLVQLRVAADPDRAPTAEPKTPSSARRKQVKRGRRESASVTPSGRRFGKDRRRHLTSFPPLEPSDSDPPLSGGADGHPYQTALRLTRVGAEDGRERGVFSSPTGPRSRPSHHHSIDVGGDRGVADGMQESGAGFATRGDRPADNPGFGGFPVPSSGTMQSSHLERSNDPFTPGFEDAPTPTPQYGYPSSGPMQSSNLDARDDPFISSFQHTPAPTPQYPDPFSFRSVVPNEPFVLPGGYPLPASSENRGQNIPGPIDYAAFAEAPEASASLLQSLGFPPFIPSNIPSVIPGQTPEAIPSPHPTHAPLPTPAPFPNPSSLPTTPKATTDSAAEDLQWISHSPFQMPEIPQEQHSQSPGFPTPTPTHHAQAPPPPSPFKRHAPNPHSTLSLSAYLVVFANRELPLLHAYINGWTPMASPRQTLQGLSLLDSFDRAACAMAITADDYAGEAVENPFVAAARARELNSWSLRGWKRVSDAGGRVGGLHVGLLGSARLTDLQELMVEVEKVEGGNGY